MTMTRRQREKRRNLRNKNIERRAKNRERLRRQAIIQNMPRGPMHRTNPDFLNNELADFTLCGKTWHHTLKTTLWENSNVECEACITVMRSRPRDFPMDKDKTLNQPWLDND